MDNTSLPELVEALSERMSALGLHQSGPPSIHGGVNAATMDDDEDEEDFVPSPDLLIDRLKDDQAFAVIHMTFDMNNLVWTDRILYPESHLSPEDVDQMNLPSQREMMQKQIRERTAAGEDLSDILRDLLGTDEEE